MASEKVCSLGGRIDVRFRVTAFILVIGSKENDVIFLWSQLMMKWNFTRNLKNVNFAPFVFKF